MSEASAILSNAHTQSPSAVAPKQLVQLPELLAPAGDWECARAAVENGADAIYFGLEKFNARMRANNFTEADLPALMEYLHRRGVKGYVTFNTLIFENELALAEQYARNMILAGVDAAIVQDAGLCRLIRKLSPDFPIHASTQMTVTSAAGVAFAQELGCNLVVLARECSLQEIRLLTGKLGERQEAHRSHIQPVQLPLEVFVHGALCVAYSGQCLTSEALGGRSANRGECAQACRMPYELISDGKRVPLGDRRYLLSPQDLAGLDLLPQLTAAGVASLKIEGRLKSPEYVASITGLYRRALDSLAVESAGTQAKKISFEQADYSPQYEMEMAFSRGLYTGWFGGINNQRLVHGRFGKKRGVYLGEVLEVGLDKVKVMLVQELNPGDGVVFDAGNPDQQEEGGRVYQVTEDGAAGDRADGHVKKRRAFPRQVVLRFAHQHLDFKRIHRGDKLWKTSDPKLERDLRRTYEGTDPKFQRPIRMEVHGGPGAPLKLVVLDESNHQVSCESAIPLTQSDHPLNDERLAQQLGRLGGTPFRLGELRNLLKPGAGLPLSELNRLRRRAVEALLNCLTHRTRWTFNENSSTPAAEPSGAVSTCGEGSGALGAPDAAAIELIVLVRDLAQLEAALKQQAKTLYCDFEDPKKYRAAVELFRSRRKGNSDAAIFVAPPRIFKAGEEWTLRQVRSSEADGYLARNYDHLSFFAADRLIGDYSLNVANHWTAEYYVRKFRLKRLTASYDLNFAQLEALMQGCPPEWFEVTLHQHMPMFHMEHCIFCAFLSSGTDYTNCGRPCDHHQVRLRDRVGAEHPVKADAGCRNTVFNSRAQTGAEYITRLLGMGLRKFRIEFVNEAPLVVEQTIVKYRQLLAGELTGTELWRELKLLNQLGVTRGQLGGAQSA